MPQKQQQQQELLPGLLAITSPCHKTSLLSCLQHCGELGIMINSSSSQHVPSSRGTVHGCQLFYKFIVGAAVELEQLVCC